ncbi:MAG: tRNA (N6-isopentenyl adenosine(37)-C2)-methylthiotransferase MiaB [Clostridia bacterium]|nr:tRNA (N6-isopentenyl adenosine(37)-C2)-methylthiotransferase MiaB [Clostridia bacterium]
MGYFIMSTQKTYHIVTYGCQMNIHESEKIAGVAEKLGFIHTKTVEEADLVVFNTCCIRENAEHRAAGNIGALKQIKRKNKDMIIAVCGCLTQQEGMAENFAKKFPFVDIFFGTHNVEEFETLLLNRLKGKKRQISLWEKEKAVNETLPKKRTSYPNAWVNVMYGCNNFCTYCIVPYVRGRERSRKMQDVVNEVRGLVLEGYKEITLLGQNVNSYGKDLNDGSNFASLIRALKDVDGDFWIRFMTSHPKDLSEDLVLAMKENPHVCHSLHLPVQAGSNAVLRAMNRKYTAEDYLNEIKMLKTHIPDCSVTSDLMVGFPGETEEDFLDTMKLVEAVRYLNAFTFVYSRRKGTVADKMENQVSEDVKKDRIMRLIALQNEITREISATYQDKETVVLCEDYDEKKSLYLGRNQYGLMAYFPWNSEQILPIGKFLKVKITEVGGISLYGEVLEETKWLSHQ